MRSGPRGDLLSVTAIAAGTLLGMNVLPGRALRAPEAATTPAAAPIVSPAPATTAPGGVSFQASSLGSWEEVEGDFGGRLLFEDGALRLTLPLSHVRAPWGVPEGTRLVSLSLALVDWGPDGWSVVRRGPALPIGRPLGLDADAWLRDLTLTIPGVPEAELYDRSLAVVHEIETPTADGRRTTFLYAHADRSSLNRLLDWYGDEACSC